MNALVIGFAVVAVVCFSFAILPLSQFSSLSTSEKWVAAYIVVLLGYPVLFTFTIAPRIWTPTHAAGHFYPILWYSPAFIVASLLVLMALSRLDVHIDLAALLQFSTLGITAVFVAFTGMAGNDVFHLVFMIVLLLPTVIKAAPVRLMAVGVGCRLGSFAMALSVLVSVLLNSQYVVEECRIDKCGLAGKVLTAPFTDNGNILGLAFAVMLPLAVISLSFPRLLAVFVGVVLMSELSGSRTAETGIVLAITMVLLARALPHMTRRINLTGLLAGFALSLVPVLARYLPDQFSYRGALWDQARALFTGHELLGVGPNEWATLNFSWIGNLNYSPHNGWWDILTGVGLTGAAIIVIAAVLKVRSSSPEDQQALIVFYASILAISSLESVYIPYNYGIIPCTAVLAFLHTSHNAKEEPRPRRAHAQERVDSGQLSKKGS
jgi:hypothetical protein